MNYDRQQFSFSLCQFLGSLTFVCPSSQFSSASSCFSRRPLMMWWRSLMDPQWILLFSRQSMALTRVKGFVYRACVRTTKVRSDEKRRRYTVCRNKAVEDVMYHWRAYIYLIYHEVVKSESPLKNLFCLNKWCSKTLLYDLIY